MMRGLGSSPKAQSEGNSRRITVVDRGVNLHLRTNMFLGTAEMGEKILQSLIEAGDIFVPELFDGGELTGDKKVKFDPVNLSLPLKSWTNDAHSLGIIAERRAPVKVFFHVSATDFAMFDFLSISVSSRWFLSSRHVEDFVNLATRLYGITKANWGYIKNDAYEHNLGDILDDRGNVVANNPPKVRWALRGLYWANIFGPEYVEMFGREKLTTAPIHRIVELSDGGLLLILSNSPLDAESGTFHAQKNSVYGYLGEGAFNGSILPRFRTEGRKKRDARPLTQTGGVRDDVFQ